jgi:hypothetical protein
MSVGKPDADGIPESFAQDQRKKDRSKNKTDLTRYARSAFDLFFDE